MRFEEAYELLRKPGDGPVSRWLNRRISVRISLFLVGHDAPVSPMAMTFISFLTALLAVPFFLLGWPLVGGLLAQLASILDGCDGEIARLTGRTSKRGGMVDAILDRVADTGLLAALGLMAYLRPPPGPLLPDPFWPPAVLVLTALALSGCLLVSYCSAISRAVASREVRRLIATRDVRLFTIMLAGITCQFLPWAASFFLLALVFLSWFEVASCLGQALAMRD